MRRPRPHRHLVVALVATLTVGVATLSLGAGPTPSTTSGPALTAPSTTHLARLVNVGVPRALVPRVHPRDARPVVSVAPRDAHIREGATARFVARANGRPTPREQWYWASPASTRFTALRGATTTTLTLPGVTMRRNRQRFRAVFTNAAGRTTSRTVTLFVSAPAPIATTTTTTTPAPTTTTTALNPPSPNPSPTAGPPATSPVAAPATAPVITLSPQSASVTDASTVTFSAAANGSPAPSVAWWYASGAGQPFSPYPGATSNLLSFVASTAQSGWLFEAVFTNSAGSATSGPATLVVALANSNWAGYVTSQNTFTSAAGTFNVPNANCASGANTNASLWVGIDGYGSSSVEQDGVEMDCVNGLPSYGAWYEMYGDLSPQCNCNAAVRLTPSTYAVQPGDVMSANVAYDAVSAQWTLRLLDTTQGWNFSITIPAPSPPPAQASAEWILEQPLLCSDASCTGGTPANLTPTSPFSFTHASATTSAGTFTISGFAHVAIAITDPSGIVVIPGSLSADGSSFSA